MMKIRVQSLFRLLDAVDERVAVDMESLGSVRIAAPVNELLKAEQA